jgi:hypothetical protein
LDDDVARFHVDLTKLASNNHSVNVQRGEEKTPGSYLFVAFSFKHNLAAVMHALFYLDLHLLFLSYSLGSLAPLATRSELVRLSLHHHKMKKAEAIPILISIFTTRSLARWALCSRVLNEARHEMPLDFNLALEPIVS